MESQASTATETIGSPTSQLNNQFTVIWRNLTYKVDPRSWLSRVKEKCILGCKVRSPGLELDSENVTKKKIILDCLCGDIKSGHLTGILGPSGAGKTSLLRCLFQNFGDGTTGQILVDGGSKKLKVCFIPQKDYLNDFLTVREDLVYVSKLREAKSRDDSASTKSFPQTQSDSYVIRTGRACLIDHNIKAVHVADSLELGSCLDVLIKNISGGQRKRLSIARELMSKPDIIILDEPTTGLDSVTCYKTMMVLQELAHHSDHPVAVIVTIHQPPKNVFRLFDKTYFISSQGRVIFEDVPDKVTQTLKDVANTSLPTPNYNPASALIEIASDASSTEIVDRLSFHQRQKFDGTYTTATIKALMNQKTRKSYNLLGSRNSKYQKGPHINNNEPMPTTPTSVESVAKEEDISDHTILEDHEYFISPKLQDCLASHSFGFVRTLKHVCILTHRFWFSIARNSTLTKTRLMFHTLAPLVMLVVFGTESSTANNCPKFDIPLNLGGLRRSLAEGTVEKNVNELRLCYQNLSFFFILLYGFGINIVSLASTQYPLTINMFKKETINGLYSPSSYFLAQTIAEFPLEILYPSLSVILAYSLSGQSSSYLEWRMFGVAMSVCVCCYTMYSLGLLCGAMFVNNANVAAIAGQASLWLPIMLSGCLIRLPRMPDWMHAMSYLSFMKHGLSSIVAARYGFNLCNCDEDLLQAEDKVIGLREMPDNVKHVIDYLFPVNETNNINVVDMFDKLGDRFAQAQTFGAPEIRSCDEVQPHMMTEFGFKDSDLLYGPIYMIIMTVVFKIITYYYIRAVPYRIK